MKKKELILSVRARRKTRRTARLVMALLPLFFVTGCLGFGNDKPNLKHEIPDSLTRCRRPKPLPPPDTATQADVDVAMTDLYLSWEDCYGNLDEVRKLVVMRF